MAKQEKYITYSAAVAAQQKGKGIIIDVREPIEFLEGHLPGALNLPSTSFREKDYAHFPGRKVCLICQTGERARSVARKLSALGMEEVFVLEDQMENIRTSSDFSGWSVDRQFRFLLGIFLALFIVGFLWISSYFLVIPLILCLGLIITALMDKCYLRVGIAMLPWNRKTHRSIAGVDARTV